MAVSRRTFLTMLASLPLGGALVGCDRAEYGPEYPLATVTPGKTVVLNHAAITVNDSGRYTAQTALCTVDSNSLTVTATGLLSCPSCGSEYNQFSGDPVKGPATRRLRPAILSISPTGFRVAWTARKF